MVIYPFIRMNPIPRRMIFSDALQKFSNRLIPVSLICKNQKHRQENRKFSWHWKGYVREQWPCKKVRSCLKLLHYYLDNSMIWESYPGQVVLIFGRKMTLHLLGIIQLPQEASLRLTKFHQLKTAFL